jgi:hypothetical protein
MRIALVLPKHRLWLWHQRLMAHLAQSHELALFVDDHAPPYPYLLRVWLKAELAIYNEQIFSRSGPLRNCRSVSELNEQSFDVIINLAEHPHPSRKSFVIEFDGVTDTAALINLLLDRRTPRLTVSPETTRNPVAQSRPAIDDKLRLTRGLQLSFARCISLLDRAVTRSARDRIVRQRPSQSSDGTSLPGFISRFMREKISNVVLQRASHWSIALRNGRGAFVTVADDARRYYADPFLFRWQDRNFVFVEELPYGTGKGVISAAEVVGDRLLSAPVPVLQRPYHLSYPFVLAHEGAVFMLPETSANRTLELYRAIEFPWKWELDCVLLHDLALADATPIFHQGRWWLFAATSEHGTLDQDELVIFYSDQLMGPWRPHCANPVKSDCGSARPAGRIVRRGHRLLRPAQDCEDGYGAGLVWHEITELTPSRFREQEIARWNGRRDLGVAGIHSFDQLGELAVIDFQTVTKRGTRHIPPALVPPAQFERAFTVCEAEAAFTSTLSTNGGLPCAGSVAEHLLQQKLDMAASFRGSR